MKVLTTSTGDQTISVIPRIYPDDIVLTLRDDSTNTTVSYSLDSDNWENTDEQWEAINVNWESLGSYYFENGYLVITNAYALVEGRFYDLTITDGTDIIYKDKIFCTDQTINEATNDYYTINSGQYTQEQSYDNEYITF